jgi:hypothetical protein
MTLVANIPYAHHLKIDDQSAYSGEAQRLKKALGEAIGQIRERSEYFGGNIASANAQLANLAARARARGWDNEDGAPISESSMRFGFQVISSFRRDWPVPDIDLDSDGNVAFEWVSDFGGRALMSIGSTGRMSYAWLIPDKIGDYERIHGSAIFYRSLPEGLAAIVSSFAPGTQ